MPTNPHFISLAKAVEMTTHYRKNKHAVIDPAQSGKEILALSDKFDRSVFDVLLEKPDCSGIRIYYGMDNGLKVHPIVVAVNSKNEDILTDPDTITTLGEGDDIGDDTIRCPPICPPASPLNQ